MQRRPIRGTFDDPAPTNFKDSVGRGRQTDPVGLDLGMFDDL